MNSNFPADDATLSDSLLTKADALIRRNQPGGVGTEAEELPLLTEEFDDLPELTDLMEDLEVIALDDDDDELTTLPFTGKREEVPLESEVIESFTGFTQDEVDQAVQVATKQAVEQASMRVAEQLIELDSYIAQAIETWIATELPPLLANEMEGLVERLRIQTLAQMRATLQQNLSGKLSEILEDALKSGKSDV